MSLSVSRIISASPETLFDILANPHKHMEIDGSGQIKGLVDGPDRLSLGAKFAMSIQQGVQYRTYNKVIVFEENKAIAWTHIGKHVWRYDLADNDNGTTTVTESWDYSHCPAWERLGLALLQYPRRNKKAMTKTLGRIADLTQ